MTQSPIEHSFFIIRIVQGEQCYKTLSDSSKRMICCEILLCKCSKGKNVNLNNHIMGSVKERKQITTNNNQNFQWNVFFFEPHFCGRIFHVELYNI